MWGNRAAAKALFTVERVEILTERFSAKPTLTCYDTHVTVDNLTNETRVNGLAVNDAVAAQ